MDNLPGQCSSLSITQQKEENSKKMDCPICQKKSTMTCSACKSVAYCCVEHQKLDWKNHKNACQPFVIKETEDMGLGWFATRNLKAGVVLIEEYPVIQAPSWTDQRMMDDGIRRCLTCGVKMFGRKRNCSTCKWPVCSHQCEKNPIHKDNECKELVLRKMEYPISVICPCPFWMVGMMVTCMRAKALKARDPEKFKQLMALQDFLPVPSVNEALQDNILPSGMYPVFGFLDRDEFKKLLRIYTVNCINTSEKGQGNSPVYLKVSRINHSCFPNCVTSYNRAKNLKYTVRTVVPVSKGEQLFINRFYFQEVIFLPTSLRQAEFRKIGFICKCKRCLDPTELGTFLTGIKCFNCSSELTPDSDSNDDNNTVGYFLPANPLNTDSPDPEMECHRCHVKCPTSQVMETLPVSVKNVLRDISSLTSATPINHKHLDKLLTRYEKDPTVNGHLHKNYWTIIRATEMLCKKQMENMDRMTLQELERLARRLEFRLTIDDKLCAAPELYPHFGDVTTFCTAMAFMAEKFSCGMSTERRLKLARSFNKTAIQRMEALLMQDDDTVSPEQKASVTASLQRKKAEEKMLKKNPDLVFDF